MNRKERVCEQIYPELWKKRGCRDGLQLNSEIGIHYITTILYLILSVNDI
jgi:hypothetical protein